MANWLNDIFDSGTDGAEAVCEVCRRGKAINPQSLFGIKVCERCDAGEHLGHVEFIDRTEQEDADRTRPRNRTGEDRGPI